jgi:phosphatidylinositol alpha-1,6-mannosyltransferase
VNGKMAYSVAALRTAISSRIDVVFCGHLSMAPLAATIAQLVRAQLWIQVHGVEAWQELSGLYRRPIESATLITAVSRDTRQRLLKWVDIDLARVKVLPNTVDSGFQPGPKPDYLLDRYQLRGQKILLTVSRLSRWDTYKGHDRVIRVLPRLLINHPELIYLVIGSGDGRSQLEDFCAQTGVENKVRFIGEVPTAELPDHFRLADVFVMPSTGEGFGIVFLEAIASGIRVIGGNADGSVDALCGSALGTMIDPHDDKALVAALDAALAKPATHDNRSHQFRPRKFSEHLWAILRSEFIDSGA